MDELRQNLVTKRWVIIATDRATRPNDLIAAPKPGVESLPSWVASCPFCPGNEEADLEVMSIPDDDAWRVRVVRNKYPALQVNGEVVRTFDGIHRSISAVGYHEILVESPLHNTCHALESKESVAMLLHAFRQRGRIISYDERMRHITYFKNHGERAGTSLIHPHTQLIALPMVPHSIRDRAESARHHYDDTGRCVFCQMQADEIADGRRVILETKHFLAIIPYAAYSPFHTWIIPRRHESSFLRTTDDELADLGNILHQMLRKLYVGLRDPDFNYVIRSAPLQDDGRNYLHWYVTIVPRVTHSAGFELGSGMFINTTLPEESAAFLRSVEI